MPYALFKDGVQVNEAPFVSEEECWDLVLRFGRCDYIEDYIAETNKYRVTRSLKEGYEIKEVKE